MQETYVLEDLLNTLIGLERKGVEFYEKCSENSEEGSLKELFRNLAVAEKKHEIFYESVKEKIVKNGGTDLGTEYQNYIQVVINNNFFVKNSNYDVKSVKDALDIAEKLEKDTILFLTELTNIILERETFRAILEEERNHLVRILTYKKEQGI